MTQDNKSDNNKKGNLGRPTTDRAPNRQQQPNRDIYGQREKTTTIHQSKPSPKPPRK